MQLEEEQKDRPCYLTVEETPDKPSWFNNLFFCSYAMRENYLTYRDFVFVNKRFEKTRFSRSLVLICGVSSSGRCILFAFAFIQKEDEENFDFVATHFNKALANTEAPKIVVLERCAQLRASFQKAFAAADHGERIQVLYCFNHYLRCIRAFFDSAKDSQQKHFATANELLDTMPTYLN